MYLLGILLFLIFRRLTPKSIWILSYHIDEKKAIDLLPIDNLHPKHLKLRMFPTKIL